MKNLFLHCLIFLFCLPFLPLMAQSPSTQGVEFFAGFMKNGYRGCNGSSESLRFIASAKHACSVTVSIPRGTWSQTYNVPANGLVDIVIPQDQIAQVYSTTSEPAIPENKGLLITATDTISLFIANEATNSFDASFVLPTSSLLDEYMVQNYIPMTQNNTTCPNNNRSVFLIVATENSTIVDITVRAETSGRKAAGTTFSVTLQRGQSYQVISNAGGTQGDFSGTRIQARDCKKIAVFNGNVLTGIPETLSNGLDHIFEQAMPVAYWGKEFIVTSSAFRTGGDYVKITALEDLTQIWRNGALLTTLNAGASYTFLIQSINPGVCFLEATNPVAVNLYQTTSTFDNSLLGDPSMVWISPVEQQIKEITFGTFTAQNISRHYVNIVAKTEDIASITLDGVGISAQFSIVPSKPEYSFARVQITAGTHTLKSNSGFTAHVYGFGTAQGYAYSVGSSTINLKSEIYLNTIPFYQIDGNYFICRSDSVKLDFSSNAQYDSITWDMGDGIRFFQDTSILYQYAENGTYTIMNIIKRKYEIITCTGVISLYDTIIIPLHVKPNIVIEIQDTVCQGYYSDYGFKFMATRDTVVIDSATTLDPCAIAAILHLKVFPTYQHTDTVIVCEHDFPVSYGKETFDKQGNYPVHLNTVNGCDSLIELTLIANLDYNFPITASICEGESYNFYGRELTETNVYDTTFKTVHGCDSTFVLTLTVHPNYHHLFNVSICSGESYDFYGKMLTETSIHDTTFKTVHSCDSIIELNLKVNPVFEKDTLYKSICQGENFPFGRDLLTKTGIYKDTALTVFGCDSIITLFLTVNLTYRDLLNVTICSGESYDFYGRILTKTGIYDTTFRTVHGCDSVIELNLTVNSTYNIPVKAFICPGENYNFHNQILTATGVYVDTLLTIHHCDSIIELTLTVAPTYDIQTSAVICQGESYDFYGRILKKTGDYEKRFPTIHGCDSMIHLNLTVHDPVVEVENHTVDFCENYRAILEAKTNYANLNLLWSTGETAKIIEVNRHGLYWVMASIDRCQVSDQINIEKCDEYFYVPNAFTPSKSDGINDLFFISYRESVLISSFEIHIYNRYGMRVFYSDEINFVWDGTYQGVLYGNTVYTYIINYQMEEERKHVKTGRITVF